MANSKIKHFVEKPPTMCGIQYNGLDDIDDIKEFIRSNFDDKSYISVNPTVFMDTGQIGIEIQYGDLRSPTALKMTLKCWIVVNEGGFLVTQSDEKIKQHYKEYNPQQYRPSWANLFPSPKPIPIMNGRIKRT